MVMDLSGINNMSEYGSSSELDKKILIVCALEVETQGQLDDYDVLYTGVGKVNATYILRDSTLGSIW